MINKGLLTKHLPLFIFIFSIVVIHSTYLTSAYLGLSGRCIPYIHSCTSISAAARKVPAIYFFKPGMVFIGLAMIFFWWNIRDWVEQSLSQTSSNAFLWVGVITGGGLILYALNLGLSGKGYFIARRIGVLCFFIGTYSLEIMLYLRMRKAQNIALIKPLTLQLFQWVIRIVAVLIVVSILMSLFYEDYHSYDDAFEWWFMLLVLLPFVGVWFSWRKTEGLKM